MSIGTLTFPVKSGALGSRSGALVSDLDEQLKPPWGRPRPALGVLVGDPRHERMFEESVSEIQGYRRLERNWDTYGGVRASEQAIQFSTDTLKALQARPEISPPHVCPISTGVYLEWRSGDRLLFFEVDEDSLLFVMREGDRDLEQGEDPNFGVERAVKLVERFHGVDKTPAEGITQHSA